MTGPGKRQNSSAQAQAEADRRSAQPAQLETQTWEPEGIVDTTSYDSFPASDPPGWAPLHVGVARDLEE